jgi:hypothetical protein
MTVKSLVLTIALVAAAPAIAQTTPAPAAAPTTPAAPKLSDKLINVPGTSWNVYGAGQTSAREETGGPQGYPALKVTVTAKTRNAWDVGAVSPTAKPIAAGDVVLVVAYLRAPALKDGETTAVPLGVIKGAAPYDNVAQGSAQVTNQWKRYVGSGKSPVALAAGAAQATVHLGGDKHVVELGPLLIYDFGPDYDMSRLPHN